MYGKFGDQDIVIKSMTALTSRALGVQALDVCVENRKSGLI